MTSCPAAPRLGRSDGVATRRCRWGGAWCRPRPSRSRHTKKEFKSLRILFCPFTSLTDSEVRTSLLQGGLVALEPSHEATWTGGPLQGKCLREGLPLPRCIESSGDASVQPPKPTPEKWLSPSSPRTPRSTTSSRCAYASRRRLHRRLHETHAASHRSAIRRARAHALLPARAPQNPRAELSGHAGKHTRCRVMRRARAAPQHAPRRHARWPPPPLRLHFAFCFFPC